MIGILVEGVETSYYSMPIMCHYALLVRATIHYHHNQLNWYIRCRFAYVSYIFRQRVDDHWLGLGSLVGFFKPNNCVSGEMMFD